jgi:hypothetical protein
LWRKRWTLKPQKLWGHGKKEKLTKGKKRKADKR